MNLNALNPILDTPQVLFVKENNSIDDINNRMEKRKYSDIPLQPNYDPRPVSTKYSHFPMLNGRKPTSEQFLKYPEFETTSNFYTGTHNAPASGYVNNVDLETILRNQTTVLQHGAEQGVYVPSSNSDLYKVHLVEPSVQQIQPHQNINRQFRFESNEGTNYHPEIGNNTLFNHTRTQLRNT